MEQTFNIKACCALCEYVWDASNCPLYKMLDAAHNIGEYAFDEGMKYHMICDKFEINSKLQQAD